MKVFGGGKNPDWARRASLKGGKMIILVSKINKYHFLYIFLFLKIKRNIVILFMHFLVKKKKNPKNLKN